MNDFSRFQKLAGWAGVFLTVATVFNATTLFVSANFDMAALFSDPAPLLLMGSRGANWFHWSMVFDIIAYLSFTPIALLCWDWFKLKSPNLVLLYTMCGVAYSLIGIIGAVLLGVAVPTLANNYNLATPTQRESMEVLLNLFYNMVVRGLWNPLEISLLGIWALGIGSFLRQERRAVGILTLIIGVFAMLDALGWITQVELIFRIGVFGISLLIIWGAWFGITILRRPVEI
jgi:uncharacterized protein DUF4386